SLAVGGTSKQGIAVASAPAVLLDVESGKSRDLGARGSNVLFAPGGELAFAAGLVLDGNDDGFDQVSLCRPHGAKVALSIPWRGYGLALSGCGRVFATGRGSERHLFPFDGANMIAYNGVNSEKTDQALRLWEMGSGKEVWKLDETNAAAL